MSCPACGYPVVADGPVHDYMSPSPACWARYGDIMAREYTEAAYWASHRLLTDAYCGQHSIGEDRRARQSLYIHLAGLILHFEESWPGDRIVGFLRRAARNHPFPPLQMPETSLSVGIDAIHAAPDASAHHVAVADYARAVYEAWTPEHPTFRAFISDIEGRTT